MKQDLWVNKVVVPHYHKIKILEFIKKVFNLHILLLGLFLTKSMVMHVLDV